jgi:hypothetical protein
LMDSTICCIVECFTFEQWYSLWNKQMLKAVNSLQCKNQQHPLQHNPSVLAGFCIVITMCLMANWF